MAAGGALEDADGLDGLVGATVRHQDAVGAVGAQAVCAGQQHRVLEELQTNRAGQLRLQGFHLQAKRSGVISQIQGS